MAFTLTLTGGVTFAKLLMLGFVPLRVVARIHKWMCVKYSKCGLTGSVYSTHLCYGLLLLIRSVHQVSNTTIDIAGEESEIYIFSTKLGSWCGWEQGMGLRESRVRVLLGY